MRRCIAVGQVPSLSVVLILVGVVRRLARGAIPQSLAYSLVSGASPGRPEPTANKYDDWIDTAIGSPLKQYGQVGPTETPVVILVGECVD